MPPARQLPTCVVARHHRQPQLGGVQCTDGRRLRCKALCSLARPLRSISKKGCQPLFK